MAAPAIGPNGAPTAPLVGDEGAKALLNSAPAAMPQAGFPPPIEPPGSVVNPRSVTAAPVVPAATTPPPDVDVGAGLTGNVPQPDATRLEARAPAVGAEGPVAPDPAAAQASAGAGRPSLAQALKGTTGIKSPELQKIATPNAPRATGTIKGGGSALQASMLVVGLRRGRYD
jgi:hypothetical protein